MALKLNRILSNRNIGLLLFILVALLLGSLNWVKPYTHMENMELPFQNPDEGFEDEEEDDNIKMSK